MESKEKYQVILFCGNCGHTWLRYIKKTYRLYMAKEFGNCFIARDSASKEKPGKHITEVEVICPGCHTFYAIYNVTSSAVKKQESYKEEEDNPEKILGLE